MANKDDGPKRDQSERPSSTAKWGEGKWDEGAWGGDPPDKSGPSSATAAASSAVRTSDFNEGRESTKLAAGAVSTPTVVAIRRRIDEVAAELRLTGFNEAGEQAAALEELSREIGASLDSSPDRVDQLFDKALAIVASLFGVLASRPGAKLMIAGIVAILVGGTGWPAAAALSISYAALNGREAFLKALDVFRSTNKG
ncbi:MAG: hypothetical protein KIT36_07585 [Alphaproteobacteria bacterium]|nr:hypothetical protein [Alphaproteobacteria bacterium]